MGKENNRPPDPKPENLFKPGQSGNPKGRPKGIKDIRCQIRDIMTRTTIIKDPITGKEKKVKISQVLINAQISKAIKGDTKAFAAIVDRLEGKPVQQLQHTGKDGQPLTSLPPLQIVVEGVEGSEEPHE